MDIDGAGFDDESVHKDLTKKTSQKRSNSINDLNINFTNKERNTIKSNKSISIIDEYNTELDKVSDSISNLGKEVVNIKDVSELYYYNSKIQEATTSLIKIQKFFIETNSKTFKSANDKTNELNSMIVSLELLYKNLEKNKISIDSSIIDLENKFKGVVDNINLDSFDNKIINRIDSMSKKIPLDPLSDMLKVANELIDTLSKETQRLTNDMKLFVDQSKDAKLELERSLNSIENTIQKTALAKNWKPVVISVILGLLISLPLGFYSSKYSADSLMIEVANNANTLIYDSVDLAEKERLFNEKANYYNKHVKKIGQSNYLIFSANTKLIRKNGKLYIKMK